MADIKQYLVRPVLFISINALAYCNPRNAPACVTLLTMVVGTEAPGTPQTFHVTSTQIVAYMEVCVKNSNKEIRLLSCIVIKLNTK